MTRELECLFEESSGEAMEWDQYGQLVYNVQLLARISGALFRIFSVLFSSASQLMEVDHFLNFNV